MKLLYVLLAFVIVASVTATAGFAQDFSVPEWTKNTAMFWGQGYIGDGEYIQFLQFLMDEEILVVPYDNSAEIAQLENQVAGLESELTSLKSSLASDLQSAYNDGYSAGSAVSHSSTTTSAPVVDTGDEVTVVPAQSPLWRSWRTAVALRAPETGQMAVSVGRRDWSRHWSIRARF